MNHEVINNVNAYFFDGLIEYADIANSVPSDNTSKTCADNKFAGGTFADAIHQAKTGNPEFVKDFFAGIKELEALIDGDRPLEIRDVAGDYFDIADYLNGEPEVFRRQENMSEPRVVKIVVNAGMKSLIGNSLINNRGMVIVALCDELQKQGFIVDLTILKLTLYCRKLYATYIPVPNNPLDIDSVAFMVANPLFQRRLSFAILEKNTNKKSCFAQGYGHSEDPENIDCNFYFSSSNHHRFNQYNYSNLNDAKALIMDMLNQYAENKNQVIYG